MRQTRLGIYALAAILTGSWIVGKAQQPQPVLTLHTRYVLTDRDALVLGPAEMVAQPNVLAAQWSPEGSYVLAVREFQPPIQGDPPPVPEISVVLWNSASHRSRELWKNAFEAKKAGITWLPTTAVALVEMQWTEKSVEAGPNGQPITVATPHKGLLRINALHNEVQEIAESSGESLLVSPTNPFAILHNSDTNTLRVLRADGTIRQAIPLPTNHGFTQMVWSEDGNQLTLQWFMPPPKGKTGRVENWAIVDLRSGQVTLLAQPPTLPEVKTPASSLQVKPSTQTLKEGDTAQTVHPLWLENVSQNAPSRALLCADGESGRMAPHGDGVLYLSQRAAWITPLTKMPKETLISTLRDVARENAKHVGLGILMYSQDYDNMFPAADANINNVVGPYLQDQSSFDGFSYSYGGGSLADIANPSQTLIGEVGAPGGRWLLYADGHVRWQPR